MNSDGDLPLDLVGDAKVEGVIQRELERLGLDEDALESLRRQPMENTLHIVQEKIKNKENLNTRGPRGGCGGQRKCRDALSLYNQHEFL